MEGRLDVKGSARDLSPSADAATPKSAAIEPLNGTKTHPLSEHAIGVLRSLERFPRPRQDINPGVANRLMREDLATSCQMASPYANSRGQKIEHLKISDAGRAAIAKATAAHGALEAPRPDASQVPGIIDK